MDKFTGEWEGKLLHVVCTNAGLMLSHALALAILVRVIMCVIRAVEWAPLPLPERFSERFWVYFMGFYKYPTGNWVSEYWRSDYWYPDYWDPSVLGFLELLSYPVLIKAETWSVIAAWLGFKTIAQWDMWKKARTSFNRYLIGNALVIFGSYELSFYWYVMP